MMMLEKDIHNVYRFQGICGLQAGVIGKKGNTVVYSNSSDENRMNEKKLLYKVTGILPEHIVMLDQVHGKTIVDITDYPTKNVPYIAHADGMCTTLRGLCLVIRTADCVPVILYDGEKGILVVVHSGWRGCYHNITHEGIQLLIKKGSSPQSIYVLVFPSIGPEVYTVGEDVARLFQSCIIYKAKQMFLDMWGHIYETAIGNGIPSSNIYISKICTFTCNDEFFSHRKGDVGRNLNFAFMV